MLKPWQNMHFWYEKCIKNTLESSKPYGCVANTLNDGEILYNKAAIIFINKNKLTQICIMDLGATWHMNNKVDCYYNNNNKNNNNDNSNNVSNRDYDNNTNNNNNNNNNNYNYDDDITY